MLLSCRLSLKPLVESLTSPATSSKAESPQPIGAKPSVSQPIANKPALPKKPELQGDGAGKGKRASGEHASYLHTIVSLAGDLLPPGGEALCLSINADPPAVRGAPAGAQSPSWISVARQKQKIYKENSLEEATGKKVTRGFTTAETDEAKKVTMSVQTMMIIKLVYIYLSISQ